MTDTPGNKPRPDLRIIKAAWPGQGKDFNDLRMECAA